MSAHVPVDTLPLFAVPAVDAPAPSVPSRTSEAAADAITRSPFRRASLRRIMAYLSTIDPSESRSMAEIGEACGIPVHVMCARLDDLTWEKAKPGELREARGWIECVEADRDSSAKKGLRVNGYRLTTTGRARVRTAMTEDIRHHG